MISDPFRLYPAKLFLIVLFIYTLWLIIILWLAPLEWYILYGYHLANGSYAMVSTPRV